MPPRQTGQPKPRTGRRNGARPLPFGRQPRHGAIDPVFGTWAGSGVSPIMPESRVAPRPKWAPSSPGDRPHAGKRISPSGNPRISGCRLTASLMCRNASRTRCRLHESLLRAVSPPEAWPTSVEPERLSPDKAIHLIGFFVHRHTHDPGRSIRPAPSRRHRDAAFDREGRRAGRPGACRPSLLDTAPPQSAVHRNAPMSTVR